MIEMTIWSMIETMKEMTETGVFGGEFLKVNAMRTGQPSKRTG